jgi:hypothetical protein
MWEEPPVSRNHATCTNKTLTYRDPDLTIRVTLCLIVLAKVQANACWLAWLGLRLTYLPERRRTKSCKLSVFLGSRRKGYIPSER